MLQIEELYDKEYFKNRLENDVKRMESFRNEASWMGKYIKNGNILDVGCSTGEFLNNVKWDGDKYGMEISEYAQNIAKKNGINFNKNIFTEQDFFDAIIFRGTIQHIDTPLLYIKNSFNSLKKGGYIFFFATPNANSIYYKVWNTLPFLDPKCNFWIPSDKELINVMTNFGFTLIDKRYPYIKSPYSNPIKDHLYFILKLIGLKVKFPFWRNSMDLCFIK